MILGRNDMLEELRRRGAVRRAARALVCIENLAKIGRHVGLGADRYASLAVRVEMNPYPGAQIGRGRGRRSFRQPAGRAFDRSVKAKGGARALCRCGLATQKRNYEVRKAQEPYGSQHERLSTFVLIMIGIITISVLKFRQADAASEVRRILGDDALPGAMAE
jgi:hypothetical protein